MSFLRSAGRAALIAAGIGTGTTLKTTAIRIGAQAAARAISKRLAKRGIDMPSISPRTRIGSPARQTPTTRRRAETKEDVSITFNGLDEHGERVSRIVAEWQNIPHDRAVLFSQAVAMLMTQLTDKLNRGDY